MPPRLQRLRPKNWCTNTDHIKAFGYQTTEAATVGSYEAARITVIEELEAIIVRKKMIGCKLRKSMVLLRNQVCFAFAF